MKIKYLLLLTGALGINQLHAAKVVVDFGLIATAVDQLNQLKREQELLKSMTKTLTGNAYYGMLMQTPTFINSQTTIDSLYELGGDGYYGKALDKYQKIMTQVDAKTASTLAKNPTYQNDFNVVSSGFAMADNMYQDLQVHINNLKLLQDKLDTTQSLKEAQDLANAIQVEQGYIQTISVRLSAVQANVDSTIGSDDLRSRQSINSFLGN